MTQRMLTHPHGVQMLRVTNYDAPDWPSTLYDGCEPLFANEVDDELENII